MITPIDWSKLSPHELRLAERTMPCVAGPWRRWPNRDNQRFRAHRGPKSEEIVGEVIHAHGRFVYIVEGGLAEDCTSFEDGMRLVDERLRASDWLLDDEWDEHDEGDAYRAPTAS